MQTGKIDQAPILLFGKDHWKPLQQWVDSVLAKQKFIGKEEANLFENVDQPEEVLRIVKDYGTKAGLL